MSYDKLNREYYKKVRQLKEVRELLKALLENRPDTYSGTDVIKQQNKMFKFQNTVNKVEEFLEETKDVENE
jgi:predicted house-cleaning NTP pyrophosphatase (Maf/HAM1 superfamily)